MQKFLLNSESELENRLYTAHKHLNQQKKAISEKINQYVKNENANNVRLAFYLHVTLNLCTAGALFYLLY
ncbi:hypothetical protein GCM10007916_24680 [Psychromonas marina]|uniref:Uncharacterized protein n=1 Tax=Psychromonas marina TaxID=88364 RepID=A0ABQ6E1T8_9GAMM|nr:hypothetical protein [Psychromonas marina]GLS91399.1 hypothetical protein GCM10007916_24680 [Psychromonas marina]